MFIVGVIALACTKQGAAPNASLTGKWKYTGGMMSSGGPQYFVPATKSTDYLQLNTDGTMDWTTSTEYKKYTLKDSVTLVMTHADGSNYQNYYYHIKGDSLSIGPNGPVYCFEGCSFKFVKSK